MNREQISALAHTDHPIAGPIGDESVRRLLRRAIVRGDEQVLDLGCGGGEWLLRALAAYPALRAEGVDIADSALATARANARRLGVEDRLTLYRCDAAGFAAERTFDLVLSVGAVHVFGGLTQTLAAARAHLAPGGRVLVGHGFWEREPSAEAVELLGELDDLAATVDRVVADGWTPVYGYISTRAELDEYEWSWTGSLAEWALDHFGDSDGREAFAAAATHRHQWVRGYRESFGFVCLVLRATPDWE
ncbi:SAM-dependent methyltransferase [Nocardia pseudobrasiliensis]|uniref:Methyltransferase family protein n=1 Tax=Nocardia pseudobrasiliensis TaxID=45979 RepID=A0A370IB18_9NOCA|nr:class I SAM-dependent methyltransferase [Nocardia pseudobrasiliensis]RDI67913.1 methyltransferase family protein [Nocardia pseudobrasiliensis]